MASRTRLGSIFGRVRHLGAVLEPLGASWGNLGSSWAVLEPLGGRLGTSWDVLGRLGALLGSLGGLLVPLWGCLGAAWTVLAPPKGRLGASWGTSWGVLRASQRLSAKKHEGYHSFGASWGRFQAYFFDALGAFLKDLCMVLPFYLEIAQSQKSIIFVLKSILFVLPESLSKHSKNGF